MPVFGELSERAILVEEIRKAVNEMKSSKAPWLNRFPVECLKNDGMAVLEWLVRQLSISFDMEVVPTNWMHV